MTGQSIYTNTVNLRISDQLKLVKIANSSRISWSYISVISLTIFEKSKMPKLNWSVSTVVPNNVVRDSVFHSSRIQLNGLITLYYIARSCILIDQLLHKYKH